MLMCSVKTATAPSYHAVYVCVPNVVSKTLLSVIQRQDRSYGGNLIFAYGALCTFVA